MVPFPNELLQTSSPPIDSIVSELIGLGFAQDEDDKFFAATAASGGPTPFYGAASTTVRYVGGTVNGGAIGYSDITGCLAAAGAAKARGPFAWYMSPRTFYQRIYGMVDSTSRPIFTPDPSSAIGYRLFGWPVYVTPSILDNFANGSGTNHSYILFTNPRYLHIASDDGIQIAASADCAFDKNQTVLRGIQRHDFVVGPAAGIVILKGVN